MYICRFIMALSIFLTDCRCSSLAMAARWVTMLRVSVWIPVWWIFFILHRVLFCNQICVSFRNIFTYSEKTSRRRRILVANLLNPFTGKSFKVATVTLAKTADSRCRLGCSLTRGPSLNHVLDGVQIHLLERDHFEGVSGPLKSTGICLLRTIRSKRIIFFMSIRTW